MKALVTIENKDEIVEDFELNREYDKVTIDVSNGSKFYIKVTRDGNLEIMCAEGPGLFGTQLAVAPKISNVLVIGAGREFV